MEPIQVFKYCPQCQAELDSSLPDRSRKIVCANCKLEFYLGPSMANAVIISNKSNEILLVKRKFDPFKGLWDLPGGFIEYDENFPESIQRETREELNIELHNLEFLTSITDTYLYKSVRYHTLGVIYSAKTNETEIKANDDITIAEFFAIKDIPWEQISFDSIKKALKMFINK